MGIKDKVKQTVKQILTDRCDRKYDRIYQYAMNCSGYTNLIEELEQKQYQELQDQIKNLPTHKHLPEIQICPYTWGQPVKLQEILQNGGKQTESEAGIIIFADDRAALSENARNDIAGWFATHPDTDLLYGDEDVRLADGKRVQPWLKPDWSPDLLKCMFYFGGVFCVRRKLLERFIEERYSDAMQFGVVDRLGDAMQFGHIVPKLAWNLAKLAGGYEKQCVAFTEKDAGLIKHMSHMNHISHINAVLCHHREESDYQSYLDARCIDGTELQRQNKSKQTVSVIIPSKDHPDVLAQNLKSLAKTVCTGNQNGNKNSNILPEIVIVDNGSSKENREKIQKLIQDIILDSTSGNKLKIQYIYEPMEFHFSKMCNIGAKSASGELLLFLNDDVEAVEEGWLEQMAAKASLPYVGAVGAKLLYPGSAHANPVGAQSASELAACTDEYRIQHAGIVNLPMGPVHKLQFQDDSIEHYFRRNRSDVNVLAVTGACLMLRRNVFEEAGGFCEELPVAFNDVDLCFTLYEKGYYNVVMNGIRLYHHESLSRGDDESPEKLRRLRRERRKLYDRHPALSGVDPFYHAWLNHQALDTDIMPAPEEILQQSVDQVQAKTAEKKEDWRPHQGLFLRIEAVEDTGCQGYSFMSGDDNACYAKELLLEETETGALWSAPLPGRLRMDLQKNMPDQKHVAMSGFRVEIIGLPRGSYRMGVIARNNVTHVTYINRSAGIMEVR